MKTYRFKPEFLTALKSAMNSNKSIMVDFDNSKFTETEDFALVLGVIWHLTDVDSEDQSLRNTLCQREDDLGRSAKEVQDFVDYGFDRVRQKIVAQDTKPFERWVNIRISSIEEKHYPTPELMEQYLLCPEHFMHQWFLGELTLHHLKKLRVDTEMRKIIPFCLHFIKNDHSSFLTLDCRGYAIEVLGEIVNLGDTDAINALEEIIKNGYNFESQSNRRKARTHGKHDASKALQKIRQRPAPNMPLLHNKPTTFRIEKG